jgi:hypothetical protein
MKLCKKLGKNTNLKFTDNVVKNIATDDVIDEDSTVMRRNPLYGVNYLGKKKCRK